MENRMVRKANSLIEASYKLSTVEQKIILFLASTIKPDDEDFKSYPIRFREFQSFIGNTSIHYERIEDMVLSLKEKNLKIVYVNNKGTKVTLNVSWISSSEYEEGSGILNLCFDPKLKPFLLQLKNRFTNYRLRNVVQLRSQFSIRIYELLKQYEKLGHRIFTVQKLREILGIDDGQYRLYGDFKRKVILTAQEELAEKTDISFSFEEIKIGHGVGQIRFFIKSKMMVKAQLLEAEAINAAHSFVEAESLEDSQITKLITLLPQEYRGRESVKKLIKAWLVKQDFDYVARNIEYANDGSNAVNPGANLGKGSNYRVYLAKALAGDFGLAFKEDREAHQAKETKAREEKEAAEVAARQAQDKTRREQEDMDRARVYQESLSPEAFNILREEALSRLDAAQRDLVSRKGPGGELFLKRMMVRISLERMKIAPIPSDDKG